MSRRRAVRRPASAARPPARVRTLAPVWALLGLACAAPAARRAPWAELDRTVRPTLEEVFLEPPLYGTPPELRGLSPDGRWALVAWSPPTPRVLPGPDAQEPQDPRPSLRLFATDAPGSAASPASQGLHLATLLGLAPKGAVEADAAERPEDREPALRHWSWSPRGARLAVAHAGTVHLVDPDGPTVTQLVRPAAHVADDAGDAGDTGDAQDAQDPPAEDLDAPEVRSLAFAPDGDVLRVGLGDELYALSLRELPARPLTPDDLACLTAELSVPAQRLQWSRDLRVAFANADLPRRDEPAEVADDARLTPEQVWHRDRRRGVTLEGLADEPTVERARLSPDGRFVFAAAYDRSQEPERTLVPDYLTERVTTRPARRVLADGTPPPWRAHVWSTDDGRRVELFPQEDGAADDAGWWLRSVAWAPQPDHRAPARLVVERTSADFRTRELWLWQDGAARRVWSEHDEGWLGGPAIGVRWNASGSRLLIGSENAAESSTPGWCQLFALDPDAPDAGLRQLTAFEGECKRYVPLPDGGVLVEGSRTDLARRVVGFVSPAQVEGRFPPGVRWYAQPDGWNEAGFAARDGARIAFLHERLFRPAELWTADATRARQLSSALPAAFDQVDWVLPERIAVDTDDGRRVFAHVYLPPGVTLATPGPARATIVFVHGAGYLQNVTDSMTRYPLNMLFHSRLARLGYPVVDVDYRGSAGYGRDFRRDVQYHLGGKDLDDIHAVLDHLERRGLVDGARVGLYGGSYGGFMTMMALFTAPERWAVGAALRSVTDWRTYHPFYTQPRLGRPSTHPEAYARSSPIDLVDGLEDPLLVLHGMLDSNVFAQDSIRLIEALIDRGKEFDAMLYPSQGHGFEDGPHWLDEYRRIERYLLRHLGPPLGPPTPETTP